MARMKTFYTARDEFVLDAHEIALMENVEDRMVAMRALVSEINRFLDAEPFYHHDYAEHELLKAVSAEYHAVRGNVRKAAKEAELVAA